MWLDALSSNSTSAIGEAQLNDTLGLKNDANKHKKQIKNIEI